MSIYERHDSDFEILGPWFGQSANARTRLEQIKLARVVYRVLGETPCLLRVVDIMATGAAGIRAQGIKLVGHVMLFRPPRMLSSIPKLCLTMLLSDADDWGAPWNRHPLVLYPRRRFGPKHRLRHIA